MARIKCTKIELVRVKKKRELFKKYLPTLQLKKILLQLEVNKAKEELKRLQEVYQAEKEAMVQHAHLLTDPYAREMRKSFVIQDKITSLENIAGIHVPILDKLIFQEPTLSLIREPLWVDAAVKMIRNLQYSYQRVLFGEKKRALLAQELRVVSIRVNLFEKRLIPELEQNIDQIRVFLGDQELQAVAQAKVSKEKILKHKPQTGGIA